MSLNKNKYRDIMREYALVEGVCSQCFSKKAMDNRKQCIYCINQARKKRGSKLILDKDIELSRVKQRDYVKKSRKKALYDKVRKLDRIRYAVENGREL